jgi:hypothetical protein
MILFFQMISAVLTRRSRWKGLLGHMECGMWLWFTSEHAIGQWVRWSFMTDWQGHNESRCSSCPNFHPPTKCEMGPALPGYLFVVLNAIVYGFLHRLLLS